MKRFRPDTKNKEALAHMPFFAKERRQSSFLGVDKSFFSNSIIQAKLSVNQPNDKYEQEADVAADAAVERLGNNNISAAASEKNMRARSLATSPAITPLVQAKCDSCEEEKKLQKKENEDGELEDNKLQKKPIFENNAVVAPEEENNVQRKCEACEHEEETVQKKEGANNEVTTSSAVESQLMASKTGGSALADPVRSSMESAMGADFSSIKVHTDNNAVQMNKGLNAQAFTHGSDIYFNEGKYDTSSSSGKHLLAHELTHTIQQGAFSPVVQRHPVAPTEVHRENHDTIFGLGGVGGMTLDRFKEYTADQADWFTESSLNAADRADLWKLLLKTRTGSPVLSGVGDVLVSELRTVTDVQWHDLEAYCRGCHSDSHTVRITRSGNLTDRISLGHTLKLIEVVLPGNVLEVTLTQANLQTIHTESLVGNLTTYWNTFHPHLQETVTSSAGLAANIAAGIPTTRMQSEVQLLIDFLRGPNIAPFSSLLGRVRNLHRFASNALQQVQMNFTDTSRAKPVYLILYSGHDHNAGFAEAQFLFENLMRDRTKLVLMLEGQGSLQDIINEVPNLANNYGQPDAGGVHKIAQVMIAGHGGSRSVELAGSGSPQVRRGEVHYTTESLNLDANNAQSVLLLQTLMDHMDPTSARIVYAGCLVGSTSAPIQTTPGTDLTAAEISSHVMDPAHQSLADFTRQMATTRGLTGMAVEGGRGSVGLSASRSFLDAAGNMHIDYQFDPAAFANALTYLNDGREPQGVMRAAVQIAAANSPIVAANQLRLRDGRPPVSTWFDPVTNVFVHAAVDGVAVGAGIDIVKVNKLAHMAAPFFHSYMTLSTIGSSFGGTVNIHGPLATQLYTDILAIPYIATPGDLAIKLGRFIMEMGWALMDSSRAANVISYLDSRPDLTPGILRPHILDNNLLWLNHHHVSASLFPAGASATAGRIRLALAWIFVDNTNTDVRAFLDSQVDASGTQPRLMPAVIALLNSPADENTILETIGRLTPAIPPASGSGPSLEPANADAFPNRGSVDMNDIRIEPNEYVATVVAPAYVLNVRTRPTMAGRPFHWLRRGTTVNVMGFVHNWAAVDINGRLGFAHKNFLSPPP